MPTARPFAYNPNSGITYSGTTQVGNVAVADLSNPNFKFGDGGLTWYNGPDEDLGYVISYDYQSTRPQFWRSKLLTDASFLDLVNRCFKKTFSDTGSALSWLNTNKYWTNYLPNKKLAVNIAALGSSGVGTSGYYSGMTWTPSSTGVQRSWTWNFLPSSKLGQTYQIGDNMKLKYTDNTDSNYYVIIMSNFSALYNNGKTTGNNTGIYPDNVIQYNVANYSAGNDPQLIRLSGLTTSVTYKLTLMGSRTDPGFTCTGIWTITGGTSKDGSSVQQTVNDNTLNTVNITGITPNSLGQIDIALTYGGGSQGEWCSIEIDENS